MGAIAKIIESRGVMIKEEKVKSLSEKIYPNTMVLENYEPYPGYYGKNIPTDVIPRSVFLVLIREYDHMFLARTMLKISKERQHPCMATYGTITIDDKKYHCIRIKNLRCFDEIPKIQERFIEYGVDFRRSKTINGMALISIEKTFLLERFDDGIYLDLAGDNKYYFELPVELSWNDFKQITSKVKNNITNNFFDAALGYFWKLEGPQDVVRIYDLKANLERVKEIQDFYLKEIERMVRK
ncbi:MAG: hypothetical protein PWR03_1678 [Tenuifilum sp.]|uniref:hypothetical protein n=1 Tax=Tenuifilum sp. TaxID=2760880 RepID=UPI0024AA832F|nr:hypothetical protein [Tenuifilum sp.]MDI3527495.1 hypothetical protein [Tenuifilum sp.]